MDGLTWTGTCEVQMKIFRRIFFCHGYMSRSWSRGHKGSFWLTWDCHMAQSWSMRHTRSWSGRETTNSFYFSYWNQHPWTTVRL